jgi:hypothetical protein
MPRKLCNFLIDPDLAQGLKVAKGLDFESEGAILRRALRRYLVERGVLDKAVPRKVRVGQRRAKGRSQ